MTSFNLNYFLRGPILKHSQPGGYGFTYTFLFERGDRGTHSVQRVYPCSGLPTETCCSKPRGALGGKAAPRGTHTAQLRPQDAKAKQNVQLWRRATLHCLSLVPQASGHAACVSGTPMSISTRANQQTGTGTRSFVSLCVPPSYLSPPGFPPLHMTA